MSQRAALAPNFNSVVLMGVGTFGNVWRHFFVRPGRLLRAFSRWRSQLLPNVLQQAKPAQNVSSTEVEKPCNLALKPGPSAAFTLKDSQRDDY